MASDPFQSRQKYPWNIEEFNRRFPENAHHTIHTLTEANLRASGSRWNVKHLEACRVILCPQPYHLPILEPYLDRSRDQLKRAADVWQSLEAVSPKVLKQCSHQQLRAKGKQFGAFYTRLADVARLPVTAPKERPARDVQPPNRPGFVSGEGMELSSPLGSETHEDSLTSSFSQSDGYPTEMTDHILRTQHETVTSGMAAEFISAVMDLCSVQTQPDSRIEFTPAPTTYHMKSRWLQVVCEDDGSFIRRNKSGFEGPWISGDDILAVLEAKALYKSWNDDEDFAFVSTNVLAQMVCEIICSMHARLDPKDLDELNTKKRNIFLISVHQTTFTFMHATIEKDYWEYLQSDTAPDVLPFLKLNSSAQFDIENISDRVDAALEILSLVSFLDETEEA